MKLFPKIIFKLFLIINFFSYNFVFADNHNFYEIIEQLQKDIKTLEKAVYSDSTQLNNNSNNLSSLNFDNNSETEDKFVDREDVNVTAWRKSNYTRSNEFRCTRDFGYTDCVDKLITLTGEKNYEELFTELEAYRTIRNNDTGVTTTFNYTGGQQTYTVT